MKRVHFIRPLVVLIACAATLGLWSFTCGGQTGAQNAPAESAQRVRRMGEVPAKARQEALVGRMEASENIRMILSFGARHAARLRRLSEELNDPSSPKYHQWLNPEEFGRLFGRTDVEFSNAVSWLEKRGFTVDRPYPNRLAIGFTGSVDTVERAFSVQMARYWDANEGRFFRANMNAPKLPAELEGITVGFDGLNDAVLYHPAHRNALNPLTQDEIKSQSRSGAPRPAARIGSTNFIGPRDFALLYDFLPLWNAGKQGSGQKVGVIIDSDIRDSDMTTYRNQFGLPAANVQRVVFNGLSNPGLTAGEFEADLDTQSISAAAPQAEIDLILIPGLDTGSIFTAEQDVVNNVGTLNIHVISESFGLCESEIFSSAEQTLFRQAVVQGIAFFASAGDEGANCDEGTPTLHGVGCPACYDGVTGVGGTVINATFDSQGNVTSRVSETVWNDPPGVRQDCSGSATPGGSSGGGVSQHVSIPTYQLNAQGFAAGVPPGSNRFVPDVAALAGSPGALVIDSDEPGGPFFLGGGTSESSPLWAGMMALVNQFNGSPQGSPNTVLYRLGVSQYKTGGTAAYLDITSGNNNVGALSPCLPSGFTGFSAKTGYDAVSGWGVPDLNAMAHNFSGPAASGDTVGLYIGSTGEFDLRFSNTAGTADDIFFYGPANLGWIPLAGDWTGSGVVTPGLYDPAHGLFFLRNSNTTGTADITFAYGPPNLGWIPIVGDWDGNGTDTVGLFDPLHSMFFLRNSNTTGVADVTFAYGPPNVGWVPIVGHWNGPGANTIGLFNPVTSMFFLRNSNTSGVADTTFAFGPANLGWKPVVGDWNGTGANTIGLYNPTTSRWFLKNANTTGVADTNFVFGSSGAPLTGKWH